MRRRIPDSGLLMAKKLPTRDDKKPYADSESHLTDHLRRIDLLVKAQVIRWRSTIAEGKPENLWGMVHVTDAEVHAFLKAPWGATGAYPADGHTALEGLASNAQALAESIQASESKTPPATILRLRRLEEIFSLSPLERDILLACL